MKTMVVKVSGVVRVSRETCLLIDVEEDGDWQTALRLALERGVANSGIEWVDIPIDAAPVDLLAKGLDGQAAEELVELLTRRRSGKSLLSRNERDWMAELIAFLLIPDVEVQRFLKRKR